MAIEPRLNIVTLGVADVEKARKFYEGLGWKASSASQGNVVFFQLGAIVLQLYPREALAEDADVEATGSGFSGITLTYNTRSKEEVAGFMNAAKAAGGKIVNPAENIFWGGHRGYFADLDGHLWEVAWYPNFELNERGEVVLP